MLSEWQDELKYEDGEKVKRDKSVPKTKIKVKNKKGRYGITKVGSGVGLPFEERADIEITEEPNPIHGGTYIKVDISRPKQVTYIVGDRLVIKAENPNNTTFEGEYNGS